MSCSCGCQQKRSAQGATLLDELLNEVDELETEFGGDPNVRWLQNALNHVLGIRLASDGIAGPATRSAVRSFQERYGLPVDGIAGPQTRARLAQLVGPSIAPTRIGRSKLDCDDPGTIVLNDFDFERSELKAHHRDLITEIVRCLGAAGAEVDSVELIGHTDRQGSVALNQSLSEARANSVRQELEKEMRRQGVPMTFMITASGRGKSQLLPPAATDGMNRRVEILVSRRRRPRPRPRPRPRVDPECEDRCLAQCRTRFEECLKKSSTDPLHGMNCIASWQSCSQNCRPRCTRQ